MAHSSQMKKNDKLGLKAFTPNVAAKIAFGVSARQALEDRERARADAAEEQTSAVLRAAEEARMNAQREQRAALIRLAILRIDEGLQGWRGIARRNRAIWTRTRPLALEWTRLDRPNATRPSPHMIAARSAELIVQEWLEARFGSEVHDVSDDKTYDDGDGPAFKRYDLRCKSSHRRFDVKNAASPGYAQHVLGRDLPADLVTLVGLAKVGDTYGPRFELLGAADGEDLARWDRTMQDLDGVGIFVPPTRKRKGARIRPSWIFSSFRHPALARDPSSPDDPIAELDDLDAWREVPERLRLLSPTGRHQLHAGDQDTDRLLSRFARRMEELRLDRLELRHLYVLTLEDFRRRYQDADYDPSVYGRAFVPDGLRHTDQAWYTPGGTWDPCRYYRSLLAGLTRLHRHRAAIPALIHTIHVTPAGTIIANLRRSGSKGGPAPATLVTVCGNKGCDSRSETTRSSLLVRGDPDVIVDEHGFLQCPACGRTSGRDAVSHHLDLDASTA